MSDIWLAGQTLAADDLNTWVQAGTADAEFDNETAITVTGIPFHAPFESPPFVTALLVAPTVGTAVFALRAGDVTTTDFAIRIFRADSATNLTVTYQLNWTAVGRPVS